MVFATPAAMVSVGLLLLGHGIYAKSDGLTFASRRSPPYTFSFQFPLTIPQIKKPLTTYTNPETGVPINFYQVEIKNSEHIFYPNLKNGSVWGYDGTFPGPTFQIQRGHESVVRVINKLTKAVNFHVHGSYTRSPWDGWAEDVIKPGEFKDYYYPNLASSRTLWYHDHSNHDNAVNIYKGLFGAYQIVDTDQDRALGIPTDPKYDIPMMFTAHYFTSNGDLTDESNERASIYGDTWLVNGKIQPFLDVEPRKYRFRILNGAASRTLNLTIESAGREHPVAMDVIASDGGLRQSPASTKSLITGMGERWEIIVDFAPYAGKKLTARATNMWTDKAYEGMEEVLQFRVGKIVTRDEGNAPLPARFDVNLRFPEDRIAATREFKLVSHMDMMLGINSYHMDDTMKRILMRPPLGTIEKYVFRSDGMGMGSSMGGGMNGGSSGSSGSAMMGGHNGMMENNGGSSGSSGSMMMGGHGGMMENNGGAMSGNSSTAHSSHHGGGGMMGMGMMKNIYRRLVDATGTWSLHRRQLSNTSNQSGMIGSKNGIKNSGSWSRVKSLLRRQMNNMMGGNGSSMSNMMGNQTMMQMGGYWTHAMHLHLVDMKVISRTRDDTRKAEGRDYLENYEKNAVKDVVLLGSNERIEVLVKFVPYSGVYMFHCHNMVHEDLGMMAVMNISRLTDLGYSGLDSRLENPMDTRFRPQKYSRTNLDEIKSNLLPAFAALKAYPDPVALAELEEKYWAGRELPKADQTSEQVTGEMDPRNKEMMNSMHGSNGMAGMNGMGSTSGSVGSSGMDMKHDSDMVGSTDGMVGSKGMNGMGDMMGSSHGESLSNPSSHSSHHG